jgi:AcrR family transcriptional regulator
VARDGSISFKGASVSRDRQVCLHAERLTGLYNRVKRFSEAPLKPPPGSTSPRDRLLDTAGRLFHRHGFQAVGIDRILEESGVAKMTLYRHFPSKDALIAAYLSRADAQFWAWAEEAMARARSPQGRLLALFEGIERLAASPECLGCVFQGAVLAFPEHRHPGHAVAVQHKKAVRRRLGALVAEAGLRDPERLAAQLSLLIDGAWIGARTFEAADHPAAGLTDAARTLIESHRRFIRRARAHLP